MRASIADHAVIKIDAVVELIECGLLGVAHGVDCSIGWCYKPAGLWVRHDRRRGSFFAPKSRVVTVTDDFHIHLLHTHNIYVF